MHVGAAELLGRHDLADRRLHQRRPAEEDRALVLDDDALVRHRRHVGAAGGARAHHHRDLRDAGARHGRLVVEDAAEMLAVGEHLVLVGQVGAAGIDQVDARQVVLARDLLGADVLLDGHREIRAALDRGVVAHDHAFAAGDAADAGDDAGRGDVAAIHVVRRELRQLEERRADIEQHADAVARQQLAALDVLVARGLAAALLDRGELGRAGRRPRRASPPRSRGTRRRGCRWLFSAQSSCLPIKNLVVLGLDPRTHCGARGGTGTGPSDQVRGRHEKRYLSGARHDRRAHHPPVASHFSTCGRRSEPQNASPSTKIRGEPNTLRAMAASTSTRSRSLTAGSLSAASAPPS